MRTESRRRRRARPDNRRDPAPLDWRSPVHHLWVATRHGEYAGMTEYRLGRGFAAMTRTAQPLGTYPSLDQAMAALERAR